MFSTLSTISSMNNECEQRAILEEVLPLITSSNRQSREPAQTIENVSQTPCFRKQRRVTQHSG